MLAAVRYNARSCFRLRTSLPTVKPATATPMSHLSLSAKIPTDDGTEIDTIPEVTDTQPSDQCNKKPVILFAICAAGAPGSLLVSDPFTDMSGLFVCPGTHLIAITQEQADSINPSDVVVLDATIGVPASWLVWFPAIVLPDYPVYTPCTLEDVYPGEQEVAEEAVVSHSYREFPRTVWLAFELWGEKRDGRDTSICEPCKNLQNVRYGDNGELIDVFCSSCCIIISRMPENKCDGGTPECQGWRWVNGLGEVSMACRGCHEYENSRRRKAHQRSRRCRRHRSDRANQSSEATNMQNRKTIAPLPGAAPTKLVPVSAGVWEIIIA